MRRCILASALAASLALPGAGAAAPKPHLDPGEARAIAAVLTRYVPAAVGRRDLRLAYALSGPDIRGRSTLSEWLKGGIPVYPYPARDEPVHGWVLKWAEPGDVGLDLLLQPRRGAKVGPIAFGVRLVKRGGRWLVDSFLPQATFSPAGKAPSVFSEPDLAPSGMSAATERGRLSPLWFVVPGALVGGGLVLVPLGVVLLTRRRDRRAYREYLELG